MAEEVKPTDQTVMPGEQLRAARNARGMSLDEAARITCIGRSYLDALESGRYEQLPSPAYVKGIMRSYARFLGIPPEPLIDRYDVDLNLEEVTDDQTRESAHPPAKKPWPLLLIIGLIICAVYIWAQRDTSLDQPPSPAGPVMSVAVPVQGILPPRTSHALPVAPPAFPASTPSHKETQADTLPGAGPKMAVLVVKVSNECSIIITIDDASPQQYDLKPGDQVEWMGERYFALEMTNAGAIEAELNGKQLPPLGKSGDPVTVVVTADGQIE